MNTVVFIVKPAKALNGARNGKWYVLEVAGNGEPDGVSQQYSTKSNAKRAAIRKARKLSAADIPAVIRVEH